MHMDKKPAAPQANKRSGKASIRTLGEPDAHRAKQTGPEQGPVEGEKQDLQRHSRGDGRSVECVRIVFAHELPECDCCQEPWCPVHQQHYADCECIGPHNVEDEGYRLVNENGTLYGVRES